MIAYFLLAGIVLIFALLSRLYNSFFYNIILIILAIFSGLRYNVGKDFLTYLSCFEDYNRDLCHFEIGNEILIYITKLAGVSPWFLFLIYSFVTIFSIGFFIKKMSPNKELSILMFALTPIYFLSTLNLIRQWVAIGLFALAIIELSQLKRLRFILLILLATFFHTSAGILIFLLISTKKLSVKFFIVFSSIYTIFLGLFSNKIIEFLALLKYGVYLEKEFEKDFNLVLLALYICILVATTILGGYFSKSRNMSVGYNILLNMNFFSILILITGYKLNIELLSLMRLNMYFTIQLLVLLPMLLKRIKEKEAKIIFTFGGLLFLIAYYSFTVIVNGVHYDLVPYKTIFSR